MKIKISLFFLLITTLVYSQENNVLGFYCGYSGSGTVVVDNVSYLLSHKNYNAIRRLLYSKVPAENFLGVIVCKRLAYDKKLTLTPTDLTTDGSNANYRDILVTYSNIFKFFFCL